MSRQVVAVAPSEHHVEDDFVKTEDETEVHTSLFNDLQYEVNFFSDSNDVKDDPLLQNVVIKVEHSDSESVNSTLSSSSRNRPARKCRAKLVNYTELELESYVKMESSAKNDKANLRKRKTETRLEATDENSVSDEWEQVETEKSQEQKARKPSRRNNVNKKTDTKEKSLNIADLKAIKAKQARERRANETEEQRRLRLDKVAARKRARIAQETEEEKAIRRRRDAERHQLARTGERTEEEKASRRQNYERKHRACNGEETKEEKATRRLLDAERHRARLAEETEEEKAARRRREAERYRARVAEETEEQRAARRQRHNKNERVRRSKMTEEHKQKLKARRTLEDTEERRKAQRVRRYMSEAARRYVRGEEEWQRRNRIISAKAKERRHNFTPEQKKRYLDSVYRSTRKYLDKLKQDPVKRKEKADKLQQKAADESPEKRHKRLYKHKVDQAKLRLRKQLEQEDVHVDMIKEKVAEFGKEMWDNMPPFTNEISKYKPRPRRCRKSSPSPTTPTLESTEVEGVQSQTNSVDYVDTNTNQILFWSKQSKLSHSNPDFHVEPKHDRKKPEEIASDAKYFSQHHISSKMECGTRTPDTVAIKSAGNTDSSLTKSPLQLLEPDSLSSNSSVYTPNVFVEDEKCSTVHAVQDSSSVENRSNYQEENDGSQIYDIEYIYMPSNYPLSSNEISMKCSASLSHVLTFDVSKDDSETWQSMQKTISQTTHDSMLMLQSQQADATPSTKPRKTRREMCDECGNKYVYIAHHKRMVHNPERPMTKCPECALEFKHSDSLWHHFSTIHMVEPSVKTVIQDSQPVKKEMTGYINNVNAPRVEPFSNLICQDCGKTFDSTALLNRHYFNMHGTGSKRERSVCPHCGNSYKHAAQLNAHIRQVHEGQHFRCDICNRDCQSDGKLWRHKVEYHKMTDLPAPKSLIECEFCGETLLRGYEAHVKKHHPDKLEQFIFGNTTTIRHEQRNKMFIKCPECHKEITQGSLTKHLRNTHKIGTLKSFPCPVCNREFKERYHLNEHIKKMHDTILEKIIENKLYHYICLQEKIVTVCRICGESWGENFDVRTHLVSQHPNVYKLLEADERIPFNCKECPEESSCEDKLREHMEFIHSEQIDRCPKCSMVMVYWFEKEHHLTQGCNSCLITTGIGKAKRLLQLKRSHRTENGPGRNIVQCSECGKGMKKGSLNRHMTTVHGIGIQKTFTCPECNKEFKQASDLNKHIRNMHASNTFSKEIKAKLKISGQHSSSIKKRKHGAEIPKRKSLRGGCKFKKNCERLIKDAKDKKRMKSIEIIGKFVRQNSSFVDVDENKWQEQTQIKFELEEPKMDINFSITDAEQSLCYEGTGGSSNLESCKAMQSECDKFGESSDLQERVKPAHNNYQFNKRHKSKQRDSKICMQKGITKSVKIHL